MELGVELGAAQMATWVGAGCGATSLQCSNVRGATLALISQIGGHDMVAGRVLYQR